MLGGVIAVWQRFGDELSTASQKKRINICISLSLHIAYRSISIYRRKCNHSNLTGSVLKNNCIIIILSTLNIDLIENMVVTTLTT